MKASRTSLLALVTLVVACSTDPSGPTPAPGEPGTLAVLASGQIAARYTAEVWSHGSHVYTTTWGTRFEGTTGQPGNALYIWSQSGNQLTLVDSVLVAEANTLGDVQVTADGRYLIMPTEREPGSILTYDLTNPIKPALLSVHKSSNITRGVHTTEVQMVNGRLLAFLAVNGGSSHPPRLIVVDLSDPRNPAEILVHNISGSFIHDVFVRDGILFVAEWSNGMTIFDIGGGGKGGTVESPVLMGGVRTAGGQVHNIWWFHDPQTGSKRYAFVGEEGPASLFTQASGDLHVVDLGDFATAREVAFMNVPLAGVHNFSMDEARGILYAAWYNGGVQAIDVRGDLGSCSDDQKAPDGRCDLAKMGRVAATGLRDGVPVFVWGVHYDGTALYASDMLNGLWKLAPLDR